MPPTTTEEHDGDDFDADEEQDEDEAGTETAEASPPVMQAPVRRPRARRAPPPAEIGDFGAVPVSCIAWGIKRANLGGGWDPLSYGENDVHRHMWPIAELSKDAVISRWGPGTYRTTWFKATPGGGRHYLGMGQPITYLATTPEPAAAVPTAANPLGESFGLAMQLMQVIGREKNEAIAGLAQMAQLFAGQQKGGLGAAELQLILQNQAAANEKAIAAAVAAAVAPLQAQVAAIAQEEGEDDGAGQTIASAVGAAAPFFKGKGTLSQVANFVGAYPDVSAGIVDKVGAIALGVIEVVKQRQEAASRATQPPPEPRPRALHGEQPTANANPVHDPMNGAQSLSDWRTSPDPAPAVQ